MLNLLIAYDHVDTHRGDYFQASHDDLVSNLSDTLEMNRRSINTELCTNNSIDHYIRQFNGTPFIFVAYAHGSVGAIQINDVDYIHHQNAYLFSETLFYACSCLTAKELGRKLRENGCKVFIGYNQTITTGNPQTEPIYYTCENAFLTHFLNTENSIQDSLKTMYDTYNDMRKHLVSDYGVFEAGILDNNLDAFEIICDEEDLLLTKIAFQI